MKPKVRVRMSNEESIDRESNPSYYKSSLGEVIDLVEAYDLNFCTGNILKYILRAGKKSKDPLIDLMKARWYLDRYIEKIKSSK